jgi:hypothetical protein
LLLGVTAGLKVGFISKNWKGVGLVDQDNSTGWKVAVCSRLKTVPFIPPFPAPSPAPFPHQAGQWPVPAFPASDALSSSALAAVPQFPRAPSILWQLLNVPFRTLTSLHLLTASVSLH